MSQRKGGLRFQPAGGKQETRLPVGKKQILTIERLAHDGRGIAFEQGRTWFVSGALAQEQVRAEVLAVRSKVVEAKLDQLLQASPLRQAAACQYFGQCGGCTLQHLSVAEQLNFKQQAVTELFAKEGLQDLPWQPALHSAELAYRRRARIAVHYQRKTKQLSVGFRALASKQIVDIDNCLVLEPVLQQLYQQLLPVLQQLAEPQAIGHLELFSGDQSAVLLRLTQALTEQDQQLLRAYAVQQNTQLWWQLDAEPYADQQPQDLSFSVAEGLSLQWRPGDFVQVNAQVNQQMIAQALAWLAPTAESRVLDLFCGLGNFSLPLAQRAKAVIGVEGAAAMVQRAQANAEHNQLTNAQFMQADLTEPLSGAAIGEGFDGVLLDPPRDGAYQLCQYLPKLGAARVLYVSCNPATLARDAAIFLQHGYTLQKIGVINMFPQTGHIETMALFTR